MKKNVGLIRLIVLVLFSFSTAYATVWYVHPDSVLNSIQAGLDLCAGDDTVLVAPGIYYENLVWPNTQGIDLVSEYGSDTTIIDGDSAESVITISTNVDSTTVINAFTIRNGYALPYNGGGIDCYESSPIITKNTITENIAHFGGGIKCQNNSSPFITSNTITGNTAVVGGGIDCGVNSSPTITGNTIVNNTASLWGGGIDCISSSPFITGNTITGNTANGPSHGGGIRCYDSSPIIDSCTISNNKGDGLYCEAESSPMIHYNNITGNFGYGVINVDDTAIVHAEYNWWGDPSGPGGCGPGTGDSVSLYVDYDPWVTEPFPWGIEEHEPIQKQKIATILIVTPNPFREKTDIRFSMGHGAKSIGLKIYDATGRLIKDLSRFMIHDSRYSHITWLGDDSYGRKLPSGVYFLKFQAGDYSATEKLLLIR